MLKLRTQQPRTIHALQCARVFCGSSSLSIACRVFSQTTPLDRSLPTKRRYSQWAPCAFVEEVIFTSKCFLRMTLRDSRGPGS